MSKKFPLKYDPLKQLVIKGKTLDFDKLFAQYGTDAKPKAKLRGKPLIISISAQLRFTSQIDHAVDHMIQHVNDKVKMLFRSEDMTAHIAELHPQETGQDASVGSQARILTNAFKKQFDKLFGSLSVTLAADMVADINQNSQQQAQSSLADVGATLAIDPAQLGAANIEILKASVATAVNFIQSIPEKYLNSVNDAVLKSITTGNGLQDLQPFLDKFGNQTKNWAKNTALDQTRKTFNNLNLGRMTKIGVKRGEWVHSGGSQHPRPLHEDYDGKSFDLSKGAPVGDNGGNYVMTGEEPNCHCTFTPILDDLFKDDDE